MTTPSGSAGPTSDGLPERATATGPHAGRADGAHGPGRAHRPADARSSCRPARSSPAAPAGRPAPARGSGQADRRGDVRRRPRLPGCLVRRDDPIDRRPRPARRARPRPGLRLVDGRRRDRRRHPRRRTSSASIKEDQPILVPVGGEIQPPRRAARPPRRAGPGDAARRAPPAHAPDGAARAASSTRSQSRPRLRPLRDRARRGRCGDRRRRPRRRGRVPGRPPGAAVHREQRDDRRARRGRRDHRPRLAPVPVLRPPALKRALGARRRRRPGRPGGDRRRVRWQGGVPVDPRRSTRRSWPGPPGGRSG